MRYKLFVGITRHATIERVLLERAAFLLKRAVEMDCDSFGEAKQVLEAIKAFKNPDDKLEIVVTKEVQEYTMEVVTKKLDEITDEYETEFPEDVKTLVDDLQSVNSTLEMIIEEEVEWI